jgi:hypothetical protein
MTKERWAEFFDNDENLELERSSFCCWVAHLGGVRLSCHGRQVATPKVSTISRQEDR